MLFIQYYLLHGAWSCVGMPHGALLFATICEGWDIVHGPWNPLPWTFLDRGRLGPTSLTLELLGSHSKSVSLKTIRGLQRDVVYLCWPKAPSYTSPNSGGLGGLRGLSQWVQLWHHLTWSPDKLWRSTSLFNLWKPYSGISPKKYCCRKIRQRVVSDRAAFHFVSSFYMQYLAFKTMEVNEKLLLPFVYSYFVGLGYLSIYVFFTYCTKLIKILSKNILSSELIF